MATVDAIARAALGDLAVDQHCLLSAHRWVNDRYAEFAGTQRLRHLRRLGELTIPPTLTTGTVTVTKNSRTVTGTAPAVATWAVAIEGRYLQIGSHVWYRIANTDLTGLTLQLAEPYAEASASAQTYRIVARTIPLAEGCRTVVGFYHDRLHREIVQRSLSWLNLLAPERFYLAVGPQTVVDIGEDLISHRRLVEFYPYSTEPEHIRYAYYGAPERLEPEDLVPSTIDQDALKEGVLIDVMRYKMAKAADVGQLDAAALWRNEYRAQETKWQGTLMRLRRADMVLEDLTWITRSGRGHWMSDITNAHDQVYATGTRP